MNNNPLGIIDSGVGGLSIASVIAKKLPNESIIYLGDSASCPYGEKTPEQIYELSKKMVDYLLRKNIKLLLIACNTITVSAIDRLRKDYPQLPIVGIVPVLKTASEKTKSGRIGIFSTNATADSQYQRDLVNRFARDKEVLSLGSSDLVPMIEKLDFGNIDAVLKRDLEDFQSFRIDTLALGCSHFPLIRERIQKLLPKVLILDSSGAVTRQVKRILEHNNILSQDLNPVYNFYTTGERNALEYFVKRLFDKGSVGRVSLNEF